MTFPNPDDYLYERDRQKEPGEPLEAVWTKKELEAMDFTPRITHAWLAPKVLAVATTRIDGTWAAYVDSVTGQTGRLDIEAVLDHGATLNKAVASVMFPGYEHLEWFR